MNKCIYLQNVYDFVSSSEGGKKEKKEGREGARKEQPACVSGSHVFSGPPQLKVCPFLFLMAAHFRVSGTS